MIDVILEFAGGYYMVRVIGDHITFGAKTGYNVMMAPIDNMKLDYPGTIREFPDLETNNDWRKIAIQRFKDKIKSFKTEEDKVNYIIQDLSKFGYKALYKQKAGFRVEVIK